MSIHKSIAKSAGIVGLATLCSRILGFLRDIVIARLFGTYVYAQAFVIAFRIPNLFRDLVGEGAANAALVPVFSEYSVRHSKEDFWELANVVLNLLLIILMSITVLGIIFSPLLVRMIAPGFVVDPAKLAATIKLNRIIFPYILLISLAAYSMGILNSLRHFSIPAFAPCLLNVSIIVFALLYGEGIKGLALGVLVGGVLQLAVQIPVLYQKGFHLRLFKRFKHPAAKTIGKLMLPRLFSSSIYQLNNFVDSIFGSLAWIVGEGGVAILYFSYRLIQFPLGIFSNALAQTILPTLSTQALEETPDKLKQTLSWGLRQIFFVLLPASVGLMALSRPIVSTIFEGGKFDMYSSQLTASALFYYSIGLFAYGATKVLQSCFFALKDTVTPTKVAFLALVVNIVLNSILMFPLKIAGLALATSISGINTFFILFIILNKRIGNFDLERIYISFVRILLSSLFMGLVCHLVYEKISVNKYFNLAAALTAGILSYIFFCFIFRVEEMRELWRWIKERKKI
ncbi:MAG: murein biosynthesis integral membrane protein MurJ [Candidatus Omnitrophica bacterium]|nr:murein biosynthesis integral membrane protein MurJ [Candidatus Omnitrophota bacterium]MDD5237484.1 murein biosynthesis integral membrane protein MurJ [Candidatus Omnitrophota bacterium]